MAFSLTSDQLARLKDWKKALDTEANKQWKERQAEASATYNSILVDSGFDKGNDLKPEQINELFRKMKVLSANRALGNNLYTQNTISEFNSRLRTLLVGQKQPIANRINQFLELTGVQELTTSHFLYVKSYQDYPLFSWQTYEALQVDSTQEQEALKDTLRENSISDQTQFKEITISYLQHWTIFREVKKQLDLDDYSELNIILWDAHALGKAESEEPQVESIRTISIEKGLVDHLEQNPSLIEKGLTLVGREYHTDVGFIDLLFKEKSGKYLVVETKKDRESDKVIGQTQRYMGWVMKHLGECRGMIVVGEKDERLEYAVLPVKDSINLKRYEVEFKLFDF